MGMVASPYLGVEVGELVTVDGRQAGRTPADSPVHGCDRPSGSGGWRSSWLRLGREGWTVDRSLTPIEPENRVRP